MKQDQQWDEDIDGIEYGELHELGFKHKHEIKNNFYFETFLIGFLLGISAMAVFINFRL